MPTFSFHYHSKTRTSERPCSEYQPSLFSTTVKQELLKDHALNAYVLFSQPQVKQELLKDHALNANVLFSVP